MLGIVLMILKVIGLFLLGILGLFIALVLLILFLPIPYRVWLNGDSGDLGALTYRVKIFGIQVFPKKEPKKKRKRIKKRTEGSQAEGAEPADAGPEPANDQKTSESQTVSQTPEAPQTEHTVEKPEQETQKKRKVQKCRNTSKGKEKTASERDIRGMLQQLYAEFKDEGNRRAIHHVFSEIQYLLKHFGPRRVRADMSFSLGDPANTGYATAALSVCPFSYGKDCHIIPDFETEQLYVRGWMDVRGHMRAVHVLIAGLHLLFDKDIRRIIRKFLKKK